MTPNEKEERFERNITIILWLFLLLVILGSCGGVWYTLQTMPHPELSTPSPVNAIDITPFALQMVLKVIGAGIVLIALYNFFKTKTGQLVLIVLFVIAIIVGVGYSFFYSDKNGDGESEPMIIGMVQMNGTDSERDKAYSEINGNNGSTNLKTVGAGFIWFTGFLIALVIISGVIICLKYALKL